MLAENDVRVIDETGDVLDRFDADSGTWLDEDRLVLFDAPSLAADEGVVSVVTVGLGDLREIGSGSAWLISNGRGMVAMGTAADVGSTSIWDGSDWLEPIAGYPLGWSTAGDLIAVIHITQSGRGVEGRLEILRAPAWETVWLSPPDLPTGFPVRFDPTGRYVAFQSGEIHLADLESGETSRVGPEQPSPWFGWRSSGVLAIADTRANVGYYEPNGTRTTHLRGAGDAVQTSADGSATLLYTEDYGGLERPSMTLIRQDTVETIEVRGTTARSPILAPDGHALLMYSNIEGRPMLIVGSL